MGQQEKPGSVEDPLDISPTVSAKHDDSYGIYQQYRHSDFRPEAKRVLRKIDFHVVPVLFAIYLIQYLDKNSLNFASAHGVEDGDEVGGQDYSWLGVYIRAMETRLVVANFY